MMDKSWIRKDDERIHKEANDRYRRNIPGTIEDEYGNLTWNIGNHDFYIGKISRSSEYMRKKRKLDFYTKPIVDRMERDIKSGIIYKDNPKYPSDFTTYIAKFSDNYKLAYEKRIDSTMNRFTYYIKKPVLDEISGMYMIDIELSLCDSGHAFYHEGKIKHYSDTSIFDFDMDSDLVW